MCFSMTDSPMVKPSVATATSQPCSKSTSCHEIKRKPKGYVEVIPALTTHSATALAEASGDIPRLGI